MALLPQMTDAEMNTFSGKCFEAWMAKVDAILVRRTGLDHLDLPDYCYAEAFEDGDSPADAARAAIRYANEG